MFGAAAWIWSGTSSRSIDRSQITDQSMFQAQIVRPNAGSDRPLPHYTEHLTWLPNIEKGSRPVDRNSNAWTNNYAVGYWLSVPPQDLPDILRRLKVVFDPIDLPREIAESERDIILREYDLRVGENIDAKTAEVMEGFL